MLIKRLSSERGSADHGWLRSFHSFSFADYIDRNHMHFGPLRVINEDWIAPQTGFGTHPHKNMEIITYMLEGALTHQDSMGHLEVINPNEVQRMTAGTGIFHSEHNRQKDKTCHLLQIWITPNQTDLKPEYDQKYVDPTEKRGKLKLIASPNAELGSFKIHSDTYLYAGLFNGGETATHLFNANRLGYIHIAQGQITINGTNLHQGDALLLQNEARVEITNGEGAEILLFDLPTH